MTSPTLPANEADRQTAVCELGVLDTPPEAQFDGLVWLAATICGTPVSLVTIMDARRQWFKARHGLAATETPRDISFCGHAILANELFVVPDAASDLRFRDNPLVTGDPGIRFYAGMPLTDDRGHGLGTLCVIDRTPRDITPAQRQALVTLAGQVMVLLQARRQLSRLRDAQAELVAERERFRLFMDNGPGVAFIKDDCGRFVYVNRPLARRFDLPEGRWLGRTDADVFSADVARQVQEIDRHVLATGEPIDVYETVPTPDGQSFHWHSYKFPLVDAVGQKFLAGIAIDRTAEYRAAESLRANEEKFRRVLDGLAEGVLLLDPDTKAVLGANPAACELFGFSEAELRDMTLYDLSTHSKADIEAKFLRVQGHKRLVIGRRVYRYRDGSLLDLDVSASAVEHGGRQVVVVVFRDVGEQLRAEERLLRYQAELESANEALKRLSVTDGLTGVKNRAAFGTKLDEEFERARRYGRSLSLIMLDVDHFKHFNDTFGHPAGDEVLRVVARTLSEAARASDAVARYGGEEFALVLPDTDVSGAMVVGERCRRAIAAVDWPLRAVTVSVGVSTISPDTVDAADLLREADHALYRSKAAGRNRVQQGSNVFAAATLTRTQPV